MQLKADLEEIRHKASAGRRRSLQIQIDVASQDQFVMILGEFAPRPPLFRLDDQTLVPGIP